MPDDLLAFLTARLDETEASARESEALRTEGYEPFVTIDFCRREADVTTVRHEARWASMAFSIWCLPKKLGMVLDTIETELELLAEMRHLMGDLASRDPQLTEHMELGLHQLDDWERVLTRNAEGFRRMRLLGLVRKPDA